MTEKEPLPQSVEVLLHAAARAATFSIVQPHGLRPEVARFLYDSCFNLMQQHGLRQQAVTVPRRSVDVSILYSPHGLRPASHHASRVTAYIYFNLMQSYRLRPFCAAGGDPTISILCSHTDCIYPTLHKQTECHVSILCSRKGCVGNNTQRLHFVYSIALCALLFLGAVIIVHC